MEKVNENDKQFRHGDWGPKYMFRGPRVDWGVIVLTPGESLKAHYHNEVEETFYFVQGTPKMIVNGTEYRVKVGDAFRLEPKDTHDIINDTEAPIKAIMIKCPCLPEDKVKA